MNVLVFGCGYIGLPLVSELIARGHNVTAADRWFFGRKPTNCNTFTGDIRSFDFALSVGQKFDAVIDLCGLSNDATAEIDIDLTNSINCEGAIKLAEGAKTDGVRRYLYASSASVYGHGDKRNLTETDACYPVSLYAQCKLLVEDHLRSIAGDGFEPVILRNATVFGLAPRMRFDLAINMMTRMAKVEQKIYVMGGGEQWRPFVHIKDLVHVFASMLEAPAELVAGETFNVGSDAMNYQIKDVARTIAQKFPFAQVHDIPDYSDKRDYHLSFAKLARLVAYVDEKSGAYSNPYVDGSYRWHNIEQGVDEIAAELDRNPGLATDATTHTLGWYKSLLDWDRRITDLKLDGKLL
jgi:nucleoside-diphosphate-sugar epimerase